MKNVSKDFADVNLSDFMFRLLFPFNVNLQKESRVEKKINLIIASSSEFFSIFIVIKQPSHE